MKNYFFILATILVVAGLSYFFVTESNEESQTNISESGLEAAIVEVSDTSNHSDEQTNEVSDTNSTNNSVKDSLRTEAIDSQEPQVPMPYSEKYSSPELARLITPRNSFSLRSIMALSNIDKFNTAMYEVSDRAAYTPKLAEISQKHTERFNQLDEVLTGKMFVEDLACEESFCMASLQLSDGYKWDDSILDRVNKDTSTSFASASPLDDKHFNRQFVIYSTNSNFQGVEN